MQYFWAVLVSVIVLLIIYGIINSKIQGRKPISLGNIGLKRINEVLDPTKRYHVALNSGLRFENMKVIGFADAVSGPQSEVVWSSKRWLILEDRNGIKAFVSPYRIMWMKEAEQSTAADKNREISS